MRNSSPSARDAGVVHQNVDRRELLLQSLDGFGDRRAIGHIDRHRLRLAPCGRDRRCDRPAGISRFRNADHRDAMLREASQR
jgi:hypothetical protein